MALDCKDECTGDLIRRSLGTTSSDDELASRMDVAASLLLWGRRHPTSPSLRRVYAHVHGEEVAPSPEEDEE